MVRQRAVNPWGLPAFTGLSPVPSVIKAPGRSWRFSQGTIPHSRSRGKSQNHCTAFPVWTQQEIPSMVEHTCKAHGKKHGKNRKGSGSSARSVAPASPDE